MKIQRQESEKDKQENPTNTPFKKRDRQSRQKVQAKRGGEGSDRNKQRKLTSKELEKSAKQQNVSKSAAQPSGEGRGTLREKDDVRFPI